MRGYPFYCQKSIDMKPLAFLTNLAVIKYFILASILRKNISPRLLTAVVLLRPRHTYLEYEVSCYSVVE